MGQSIEVEGGRLATPEPDRRGIRCFKGVPYAAPPVGALRFRAPAPVVPWAGIRPTDAFGRNAVQCIVFDDIDPHTIGTSEDCLYLNIWTPAELDTSERLPVMFWIHGGGFAVGSGSEPRYDGGELAARGIIVVTVNYRLNVFGFLAHPEFSVESPYHASGNWGLLDLIAALAWVQRNIAAFGSDPRAATIAGESAGSSAVSILMASPLAKGLFARAIAESGAFFSAPARQLEDLVAVEQAGIAFARKLVAESADDLRKLNADDILAAAPGIGFRPIIDGYLLPEAPAKLIARGRHSDVPLLAGWNKDEGFGFPLPADRAYEDVVREMFGPRASAVLEAYPRDDAATTAASVRLNPNNSRASLWFGFTRMWGGDYAAAKECFERSIRINPFEPYDFLAPLGIGWALIMLERHDQAWAWVQRAKRLGPKFLAASEAEILCLVRFGQVEEARRRFEALARLDPALENAAVYRARSRFRRGADVERLIETLRAAGLQNA
jgi:para-nitrobenzyl esterase